MDAGPAASGYTLSGRRSELILLALGILLLPLAGPTFSAENKSAAAIRSLTVNGAYEYWGTVYGKDKVLDFTYVDDCVNGICLGIASLTEGKVQNETINLAYGEGFTLLTMTELIGKALGVEPRMTVAEPLVGEVTHYIADITKATELLGFQPQVTLPEGINRSVAWQKEWMKSRAAG